MTAADTLAMTDQPGPKGPMNMCAIALSHPAEKTAIVQDGGRSLSYGDLTAMTHGLAGALAGRVAPGDRVGVFLGQDPWCAAAHLALWYLGAISVPLFKLFGTDALTSRITDAGVGLVLTDEDGKERLKGLAEPIIASALPPAPPPPMAETGPETPAVLIYTSGTTGKPKGALHGHRVLSGHIPGVALSHDGLGQPRDCLWTPADWAWIGGLFDVLMPGLALGVPVVSSAPGKFDPAEASGLIARHGVRNVFFPPTALRMLKAADRSIPGLRSVASGGEPLGTEMRAWGRQAFGLDINEFYGQTECNMCVSSHADAARPGCAGQAVPGFDVAVIDASGQPTECEGEIAVRRGAPSMMLRYWNAPEATAEKFRGDWLLTGDRGIMDGRFIRFVGREDDVITSSGYRIGPGEVEDCLLTHPQVATCGVVGKPDLLRTQIVKAYVVAKEGVRPTAETLQDHVRANLAAHAYPREIEFVGDLPMTVTGKVIRKELRARAEKEASS